MKGTVDPASRGSNKAKAMTELSRWERESHRASRYFEIKQKIIDGERKTLFCLSGGEALGSLPQEFSSRSKFKAAVAAEIDAIADQLGAK